MRAERGASWGAQAASQYLHAPKEWSWLCHIDCVADLARRARGPRRDSHAPGLSPSARRRGHAPAPERLSTWGGAREDGRDAALSVTPAKQRLPRIVGVRQLQL
jgi:hypothetical protein